MLVCVCACVQLTDKEKGETNMFNQVDDFKWLKTTASPNWSLLPESEAIPGDVWKKALAGGPGVVIDDTLRTLHVGKGARAGAEDDEIVAC